MEPHRREDWKLATAMEVEMGKQHSSLREKTDLASNDSQVEIAEPWWGREVVVLATSDGP